MLKITSSNPDGIALIEDEECVILFRPMSDNEFVITTEQRSNLCNEYTEGYVSFVNLGQIDCFEGANAPALLVLTRANAIHSGLILTTCLLTCIDVFFADLVDCSISLSR